MDRVSRERLLQFGLKVADTSDARFQKGVRPFVIITLIIHDIQYNQYVYLIFESYDMA